MNSKITRSGFFLLFITMINLQGQSLQAVSDETDCCSQDHKLYDATRASVIDTIFCHQWNYQTEGWVPQSITVNTRDEAGRLTEEVRKVFQLDQGTYIRTNKYEYSYYVNDSLEHKSYYIWNADLNGGSWDPINRTSYEYDDNGYLEYTVSMFSQYGNPEWQNGAQSFYYNNMYGKPDSIYRQYWNTNYNEWFYSYRDRYEYNNQMEITAEYHDWANNQTAVFSLNTRTLYVPGETENQLQEIQQSYSGTAWMNNDRNLIHFNDEGLKISILWQNWNPSLQIWDTLVMGRELFDYNAEGQMIEYIEQSHYFEWFNTYRQAWEYHPDGYLVDHLFQEWDFNEEIWDNQRICHYPPPQTVTDVKEIAGSASENEIMIAPNPATSYFDLSGVSNPEEITNISIYNQTGQLVKKIDYSGRTIPVDDLQRGLYLVRISGSGFETTQKLLIQ